MCRVSMKDCLSEETVQEQGQLEVVQGPALREQGRTGHLQGLVLEHRIEIKLVISSYRKNKNLNQINKAHSQKHFSLIEKNLNFLIS